MPKLATKSVRHKGRRKPPKAGIKSSPRNSHTSPSKIIRARRMAKALELRLQGISYPKIAERMGEPIMTVYGLVVDGLKEIVREPAEAVQQMELERIDLLLAAHFPAAASGNVEKTNVVLRISESKRKLLGLDKPQQLDLTAAVATAAMTGHAPSDNDRARQLAAFIAMTRARKEADQTKGATDNEQS